MNATLHIAVKVLLDHVARKINRSPCQISDGRSPSSTETARGSVPGQSNWDLRKVKEPLGQVSFEFFGLICQFLFSKCSIFLCYPRLVR
jgi:hypothetical protein